jgi:hypothetical protein
MSSRQYTAYPFQGKSPLDEPWDGPNWRPGEDAAVNNFHAASSSHRPIVLAKLMYDAANLYLRFRVEDRFVVAKHTEFQAPVWRDSCVEFFVQPWDGQPRESGGYFNFEINCGGALLSYYIEDPTRTAEGFAKFTRLSGEHGRRIRIVHSLPSLVMPEREEPTTWHIGCTIPLEVLEAYTGPLGTLPGQTWRGNFFKCADDCSHPHWASWSPIGEELNFHQPKYFGLIRFAPAAGVAK